MQPFFVQFQRRRHLPSKLLRMKNVILFFASLTISIFSFAQTTSDDQDSCLKKNLPVMKLPVVELETYTDLTAINHRAIIVLLDQYRCPVVRETTISDGKSKGAISRMLQ